MQEQIILSLSPFIKIIVMLTGTLCTLIIYYIREMKNDIKELNNNLKDSFKQFAPRDETNARIGDLDHAFRDHDRRITSLEEWRRVANPKIEKLD